MHYEIQKQKRQKTVIVDHDDSATRLESWLARHLERIRAVPGSRWAGPQAAAAFSLFGDLVADERSKGIVADLKRLSAPLGRARNLDVFLTRTLPAERERHPDAGGLLNLETHLATQRTEAYEAVRTGLASDEWRGFVLDLVAWINAGPWLANGGEMEARRRDQTAGAYAFAVLEKRRRQVKKRGRDLNDIATGHEILGELAGTEAGAGSASFAAGMTAADIEARTQKLVASATNAHEALIDVRPFWR